MYLFKCLRSSGGLHGSLTLCSCESVADLTDDYIRDAENSYTALETVSAPNIRRNQTWGKFEDAQQHLGGAYYNSELCRATGNEGLVAFPRIGYSLVFPGLKG